VITRHTTFFRIVALSEVKQVLLSLRSALRDRAPYPIDAIVLSVRVRRLSRSLGTKIVLCPCRVSAVALHHQTSCPIFTTSISIGSAKSREDAQQVLCVCRSRTIRSRVYIVHPTDSQLIARREHKPKIFNNSFLPLSHSSLLLHNLSP